MTRIELRGLPRRGTPGVAVLVLNGATPGGLARAAALAGGWSPRAILVAVDGGLRTCRAARRRPDLFVGDADSAGRRPRAVPAVLYPADKDFSDFAGALIEVERRAVRVVVVAGLLGGRLDHEWANLEEAAAHAASFAAILAPTSRGTVVLTARGCRILAAPERLFSLLAVGGPATVTLRGSRWALRRERVRPGSRGLSNVSTGSVELVVHAGSVALVLPRPGASS
jgi:thiamine pyrophosphokinase